MTDMDGNPNLQANEGNDQTHSDGSADADLLKTLNAINARLTNLEGQQRALQSGKDRGIAGLQDEVHQIRSNFAEILDYGKRYGDPAEAERNYKIDQFLQTANQSGDPDAGQQFDQGQATQGKNDAVAPEILQKYNVDPQSPEYIAQLKEGKSSFEAVLAVVAGRNAPAVGDNVASGVSGGSPSTSPSSGQERNQIMLKSQYDEEVQKLADQNGGYLSPRQLYFVQEKYVNEHGLDRNVLGW